jgi:hypothetical protein
MSKCLTYVDKSQEYLVRLNMDLERQPDSGWICEFKSCARQLYVDSTVLGFSHEYIHAYAWFALSKFLWSQ